MSWLAEASADSHEGSALPEAGRGVSGGGVGEAKRSGTATGEEPFAGTGSDARAATDAGARTGAGAGTVTFARARERESGSRVRARLGEEGSADSDASNGSKVADSF